MTAAVVVGALIGIAPLIGAAAPTVAIIFGVKLANEGTAATYAEALSGCQVTDGDTIRCGGERIRLLGIDSAERPGHCRPGRDCAPGDPYAATRSLEEAMVGALTIDRVGEDRYGRTLARVAGGKGDLSCWQLAHKHAVYKPQWDNGMGVAIACPGDVR